MLSTTAADHPVMVRTHSLDINIRAPHAPMTPPPNSASSASSPPWTASDLIVLESPRNLMAWEAQLSAIASGIGASHHLVSSPEHQPAAASCGPLLSPSSANNLASYSFAMGSGSGAGRVLPAATSAVDALIARYKQEAAETSLRNAIAKTTGPPVFAWMLAMGLSPSAGVPVSVQFAYARLAVQRVSDCGTARMRAEDVTLLKMLIDRMEGLERESIRAACVSTDYFHMMEAYVSKALRNRITSGDVSTEAWIIGRRIKAEGGAWARSRGAHLEASSAAAARQDFVCGGGPGGLVMQDTDGRLDRHGASGDCDGFRDRMERERERGREREARSPPGFGRTGLGGVGGKRARSPGEMESAKRVRH